MLIICQETAIASAATDELYNVTCKSTPSTSACMALSSARLDARNMHSACKHKYQVMGIAAVGIVLFGIALRMVTK